MATCAGRAVYSWSRTELSLARADSAMLVIRRPQPGRTLSVTALLLALGLGFVSGLRTFTPVAAVMLVRGGIWGIVLAVAAPSVSTSWTCSRILLRARKPWASRLGS